MTRTSPWAVGFEPRLDKKCGASAIPDNATCRKGAGAANGGSRLRRGLENAAIVGGAVGSSAMALGSLHSLSKFNLKQAQNRIRGAYALGALSEAGSYSKAKRTGDKERAKEARNALVGLGARVAITEGANYGIRRMGKSMGVSPYAYSERIRARNQKVTSRSYGLQNMRARVENSFARVRNRAEGIFGRVRGRVSAVGYTRRSGPPRHSGYLPSSQATPFKARGRGMSGPWNAYGG